MNYPWNKLLGVLQLHAIFDKYKQYLTETKHRDSAEENIRANMAWIKENAKPVCDWLDQWYLAPIFDSEVWDRVISFETKSAPTHQGTTIKRNWKGEELV